MFRNKCFVQLRMWIKDNIKEAILLISLISQLEVGSNDYLHSRCNKIKHGICWRSSLIERMALFRNNRSLKSPQHQQSNFGIYYP